ncbi:hypothetical protein [Streptomyces mirabilis]|uniref:hypothetical protein n=1 Tax=Streptomyces mirabilis TaxID=68239 RepID=UPI001160AE3D|nr:hypothetical protein [Streptomyces mirabilis]
MAAFGRVLLGVLSPLGILVPPVVGPTPVEGIEITRPLWTFWWFLPAGGMVRGRLHRVGHGRRLRTDLPRAVPGPRSEAEVARAQGHPRRCRVLLLALVAITVEVWIANPKGR